MRLIEMHDTLSKGIYPPPLALSVSSLPTPLIFPIWLSKKTVELLAIWWHFYQFTFWSLKVYFEEDSQARCLPFHQQLLEMAHVRTHLRDRHFLIAQTKWLIPGAWDCITMEKVANSILKLLILRFPIIQHSSGREHFWLHLHVRNIRKYNYHCQMWL